MTERKRSHFTSNNLKSAKIIKYSSDWNPLIFLHFSERKKSPGDNCVQFKRVCQVLVQKLSRNTCKRIDTFTGHPRIIPPSSLSPPQSRWKRSSCGGNVYPTYSRYLERCHLLYIRELQRQVSNKRHQLRASPRSTPRLYYTISNKPEYCILYSHVFSLQQLLKGSET